MSGPAGSFREEDSWNIEDSENVGPDEPPLPAPGTFPYLVQTSNTKSNTMSGQAFNFSGQAAANYDKFLGPFLFEPSSELVARECPEPFTGRMLEIAAGTGRLTSHLARRSSGAGTFVATDISEDMLALARAKTDGLPVRFQIADAQALPFDDDAFDLVFCQYGLMFLPDKQKGFDEAFRVLSPGGKYVFATWDDTRNMPVLDIVFEQILLPFFGGRPEKYLVPFLMHDPRKLETYMKNAGFHDIVVEHMKIMGPVTDAEQLVNGFLLHHALGREVAEKDPAAVPVLAERMRIALRERFGTGSFTCALSAWLGKGVK